MAVNKVVINNETKIDLSSDTATAADVISGKTFHDNEGLLKTGTYVPTPEWTAIIDFSTSMLELYGREITITKVVE